MNLASDINQLFALRLTVLLVLSHAAPAAQFWFAGEDPVVQIDKHKVGPDDYMQLFESSTSWQQAASKLSVFKISTQFATRAPDDQIAIALSALRGRGIRLALETGMLKADRGCGRGEGYSPNGLLERALTQIKRAGSQLDYVAMDEIVFYGREKTWPDKPGQIPCRDSLSELASQAAASTALVHRYFPAAQIGAIEPVNSRVDLNKLVEDYLAFSDLYASAAGTKLAFFHADIAWHSQWHSAIPALRAGLHARGVRFGVIIGGSPDSSSNESWITLGLERLRQIASNAATAPDDVVIQSWQILPTKMLPETALGSMTYMLRQAESLVP